MALPQGLKPVDFLMMILKEITDDIVKEKIQSYLIEYQQHRKFLNDITNREIEAILNDNRMIFDDAHELIKHLKKLTDNMPSSEMIKPRIYAVNGFCNDYLINMETKEK